MDSLIWLYEVVWMINRCWTWCLSWCDVLFSFVLIVGNCIELLIYNDVNIGYGDHMYWIMLIDFLYENFDGDIIGQCMYAN